jgi:hypothetical protein
MAHSTRCIVLQYGCVRRDTANRGPSGKCRPRVTGPRFQRWDFSLFNNAKLRGENLYLQFRAETFNLFNHTNFATVTTSFISASFGKVATANDPRIMQPGLKFYS